MGHGTLGPPQWHLFPQESLLQPWIRSTADADDSTGGRGSSFPSSSKGDPSVQHCWSLLLAPGAPIPQVPAQLQPLGQPGPVPCQRGHRVPAVPCWWRLLPRLWFCLQLPLGSQQGPVAPSSPRAITHVFAIAPCPQASTGRWHLGPMDLQIWEPFTVSCHNASLFPAFHPFL